MTADEIGNIIAALMGVATFILFGRYYVRLAVKKKNYLKAVSEFRWDPAMSPIQFEHHCSDFLNQRGWKARTTKGSGDQGVDVLAVKSGIRVVLQCKKYSKPVGNKAVQEAHAAMSFAAAHRAAVVSNQAYTPSARQLARSTGVLLLHFTDLAQADQLFGVKNSNLNADAAFLEEEEIRTSVLCPSCKTTLRLPVGRDGMVNCPACKKKFRANT